MRVEIDALELVRSLSAEDRDEVLTLILERLERDDRLCYLEVELQVLGAEVRASRWKDYNPMNRDDSRLLEIAEAFGWVDFEGNLYKHHLDLQHGSEEVGENDPGYEDEDEGVTFTLTYPPTNLIDSLYLWEVLANSGAINLNFPSDVDFSQVEGCGFFTRADEQ